MFILVPFFYLLLEKTFTYIEIVVISKNDVNGSKINAHVILYEA